MNESGAAMQERQRALMFAIAYRMLGSIAEAEDIVQEALLRLHTGPSASMVRPGENGDLS